MDLEKVRHELGTIANGCGFNSWDYQPDDVQDLPAAVVGGIKSMTRMNMIITTIEMGVTFYVSLADPEDAARRLDGTLSVGLPFQATPTRFSFIDHLDQHTTDAWRSVKFQSAGSYSRYQLPAGAVCLGVEILLEITA